jgi:hypothetical protein
VGYPTLQDAIDAALATDTVLVSEGTYTGAGNHSIELRGKAIVVRSVAGSALTIIDAGASESDRRRVFYLHGAVGSTTRIEGLTIRGGWAPADGPAGESWGGGVLCDSGASPVISACVIEANAAAIGGGGIACLHGASPILRDCRIADNESVYAPPQATGGWGGGLACRDGAVLRLVRCLIQGNRGNVGGGCAAVGAELLLDSCRIVANTAPHFGGFVPASAGNGGGILIFQSRARLHWCTVEGNRAVAHPAGGARGGGVAAFFSQLMMENCTVHANVSEARGVYEGAGAGIYCSYTSPNLTHCVVSFNEDGEGLYCIDPTSQPQLTCCDVYGNEGGDWVGRIAAQADLEGNLWRDPLYCPIRSDTMAVLNDSPCLPANNSCGALIGSANQGCVMTGAPNTENGLVPQDIALGACYPNPFNAATTVRVEVTGQAGRGVALDVFDLLGRRVRTLYRGHLPPGRHDFLWDARDVRGRRTASGIYFFVLESGPTRSSARALLLK